VIHWVSASTGKQAEIRVYDRLFNVANPAAESMESSLNPESVIIKKNCFIEAALTSAKPEERFQFERLGYFVADRFDHNSDQAVFNRTVTLRDTWAK